MNQMTHAEAVAECYRLTPQLEEYDEFMYLGVRWLPYTMFFHHKNYVSKVINTDDLGFRKGLGPRGETVSVANFDNSKPINLVVGGSTAMGTGTTTDADTVASRLSQLTGETWLNFGARGYNAPQELIMFLMHQHRFPKINNVVVLSGLNTLTLEGLPDELATEHGRYYYSYEFQHYMNAYNEDLKKRANSYASAAVGDNRSFFGKMKDAFEEWLDSENHSEVILSDESVSIEDRVVRAAKVTTDALTQWKLLLAKTNTKLTFVLQPLSTWTKDKFHDDEQRMFDAIDGCANNFWRLFEKLCTPELHKRYADLITDTCQSNQIKFADMNELLKSTSVINENIYIDHLHFNDLGYREVARLIADNVLDK
ncbi:MAG: SGNH/GDSL hydrolase family protein [Gammaproteobacteria bacterium]|nr:SGNH/GDSL hydrolase family protein [Gammaproteobacteria bacterium]